MRLKRLSSLLSVIGSVYAGACTLNRPLSVTFTPPLQTVQANDYLELTALVRSAHIADCFTDAILDGTFRSASGARRWNVKGFCDAKDGSVFRIRFMPPTPGQYQYLLRYTQGAYQKTASGTFEVVPSARRGPIRVDSHFPWHFVWEGTGEHYFFNGTTAYWLVGWKDEDVIRRTIDRLHDLKINRLRVTLAGRTYRYFGEPVMAGDSWTPYLTPWPAALAQDPYHPGFDYGRFDVEYWHKFERMLRYARDRDMIISVVLDMNDSVVHPAAGGSDERRYIRYAIDRLAAFSNVTWDLGDDLDSYRTDGWTHTTGILVKEWDPYEHLATSHPVNNAHQDRQSSWFDFTSFQEWSRNQHAFMLGQRLVQQHLGRIIPQTNEEYGYEDHYPLWSEGPPAESADTLRRSAWDIVMAGGYQTAGESARRGTNILPDTGGGWMNGRGDATMTMLQSYAHMVDFFTSFPWWRTEPHDDLVSDGNYCLAEVGATYAVYLPRGGRTTLRLAPGLYAGKSVNAATGAETPLTDVSGGVWTSPSLPIGPDWALLLRRVN